MAIRHKRKLTSGYAWQASDLVEGQIGVNLADGTLHVKKTDTSIKTIGSDPYQITFDNTNLVSNVLTVTHGRGRLPVMIMIYDDSGNVVTAMTSATTTQAIIDFGGTITGTWNLLIL